MDTALKKLSDVDVNAVIEYIRETPGNVDDRTVETYITVAKTYIKSETGLSDDELDSSSELVHVLLLLCQEMHDNRALTIEKGMVNPIVTSMLGHHRRNLI